MVPVTSLSRGHAWACRLHRQRPAQSLLRGGPATSTRRRALSPKRSPTCTWPSSTTSRSFRSSTRSTCPRRISPARFTNKPRPWPDPDDSGSGFRQQHRIDELLRRSSSAFLLPSGTPGMFFAPSSSIAITIPIAASYPSAFSGTIKPGQTIVSRDPNPSTRSRKRASYPQSSRPELAAGDGYIIAGIKTIHDVKPKKFITNPERPRDKPCRL